MVAFAANSVLCRAALGEGAIDGYSFTAIRLVSGALTLMVVSTLRQREPVEAKISWRGALFLLVYALPFSLAYVRVDTGTGALLLFGAVQLTMIGLGLRSGERPSALEWLGLLGAAGGVAYLVSPGLAAPDPIGAALMVVAGIGWGVYSIVGRSKGDPVVITATNFRRAALVAVAATAAAWPLLSISVKGVILAAASGALASGIGYAIWYAALKHLSATRAALVQLSVPVIAAGGGVALLSEQISTRLVIASCAILGSIAVGIARRKQ